MRVAYALISRHIEQLAGGQWVVLGIEANVQAFADFPARSAVVLLVKIQGNEAPGSEHRLSARILGPDLTYACEEMSLPFTSMNAPLLPDGWETGILFPIQLVFDVPAAGGYSVELSVDGGGSLTVPFVIQAVRPPTS